MADQALLPSQISSYLTNTFTDVILQLNGNSNTIQKWTSALITAYTEPQRHYHKTSHIFSMLRSLEPRLQNTEDSLAVQLFVFFHDWVYDPKKQDNEIQSIQRFQEFASQLQMPEDLILLVSRYIEATVTHTLGKDENDEDLKLCLDLDLEVLGREKGAYERYTKEIRKEYAYYSEREYAARRRGVLKKFLGRDSLYFTKGFCDEFEERARDNLTRELNELEPV
jgi:predicted metal-dependent HD superfamily phosphohydrolase